MSEIQHTTDEIWKPVHCAPFSAHYSVSNLGRVRRETKASATRPGHILTPSHSRQYDFVTLATPETRKIFRIHHLVAYAFHGSPPGPIGLKTDEYQCDHINADKRDNRADNLQWVTMADNMHLAGSRGHIPRGDEHPSRTHPERVARGERNSFAKITEQDVRIIRDMAQHKIRHKIIAAQFSLSKSGVKKIINRWTWKHVE